MKIPSRKEFDRGVCGRKSRHCGTEDAGGWPDFWPEVDIHDQLAEFVERIQDKLTRNRNKTRHNWFTIALEHAQKAQRHYRDGRIEAGRESLRQAWEHLERGNKASRRRTRFIAGSDGEVQDV